jgi:nucleotide-binding universal stress UspA family protein
MYKRILLAYDGSQSGQKALLDCEELAQWSHAQLSLVAVLPINIGLVSTEGGVYDSGLMEREKAGMQSVLDEGLGRLQAAGHTASATLLIGDTVDEITDHAQKINADLIVVGHKHLEGWAARWWKSSISKALIAQAHCSVLVVIIH